MSARILVACALVLATAMPAGAHRLDEYLQATLIAVEKDRVQAEIRLVPGVAAFPAVLAKIDRDADGALTAAEELAYAQEVLRDLSLAVDGKRLPLRLTSSSFPSQESLKEGLGEIQLRFEADTPATAGERRLTFVNQHQRAIGVYLVNALVARDPDIQLGQEQRSDDQSFYQLEYADTALAAGMPPFPSWSMAGGSLALILGLTTLWGRLRRPQKQNAPSKKRRFAAGA
jgi:hypothetical protein